MIRRIAIAGAFLLLAAAAPEPLWGYIGLAVPPASSAELSAFAGARLSPEQAIAAAQQGRAGRVVEIGFAANGGVGWYSVLMAGKDGLHYLRVDPAGGKVSAGDRPAVTPAELDAVGRRDLAELAAAKVDLRQAVADVTAQAGGGRVICAGVEQLGGVPQYYATTVAGGKFRDWIVNPDSGRVVQPMR